MASATNKHGITGVKPGATASIDLTDDDTPFFYHAVLAGLVPPFSPFFLATVDHYQIQALHLHPNSILILSVFAYACEEFVGVMPSMALFRHYNIIRVTARTQNSGCASFRVAEGRPFIHMNWNKKESFQRRWVFLAIRGSDPLLDVPATPMRKRVGWGSKAHSWPPSSGTCMS
jgi:hypothetical protein